MDIDSIFLEIGESGRQQIKYGAILCLLKVYTPFHILQYTFVGRFSNFYCSREGETLTNKCFENKVSTCTNLTFEENTITSEWSLVCDNNWLSKATMSALMLGFLLGALILGSLADRIGRKSNLMMTLVGLLFVNLISALTSSYSIYLVSRFMIGFFVSGNVLSIVVLISELVGPSYRGSYGLAIMGGFPIGIMFLSLLASYVKGWRLLTMLVTLLGVPLVLCHWYLVESPRWFLSKNRQNEAELVLNKIASGNGYSGKLDIKLQKSLVKSSSSLSTDSVQDLFKENKLFMITLALCYTWVVNGASYYGLTLAAGDIGTDIYTGTALSGLVEIPAVFLTYHAMEYYGRRPALAGFMMVSGCSCLVIHIFSGSVLGFLETSFALFGKMCITASFNVAYIFSGEVFATSIRNSSMGIVSGMGRVGAILSPYIVMAGETMPGFHFFVFGLLGISGGILSLWLPETKDKPLPETVAEMLTDKTKKMNTQRV
eukprot:GFUD01012213.1.p1 GENE.GFUD01012213.1~~GFUD01012213.1.p1  ORF type:complete len:487 (-),score=98.48 GFUD01012213.1:68-1528(-)